MSKPLISIITAVYNSGAFISSAIQSVLKQSYDNWEHIIIDDGSTDNTEQHIESFIDSRVKYYYQENRGVSSARNSGLEKMKGEYFCFLDADDYLPADSLKSRLKIFEKDQDIRFVDGKIQVYDRYLSNLKNEWEPKYNGNPLSELLKMNGSCFFGPSWMIRRNRSAECHFHEKLTHGEDLLFYIESAMAGGIYDYTNDVILHYRKGHQSAMKNVKGLEEGYRYIFHQLQKMEIRESEIRNFRMKARKIMLRSYLGHLMPLQALRSQLKKW